MTTVAEISGAVRRLPKRDLERFRKWFAEYDAAAWDAQLERDVVGGRIDKCRHIANATLRGRIEDLCREAGFEPPTICTPLELPKE